MGMPISIEIVGGTQGSLEAIFDHFTAVDERFSTYKPESEISLINRGKISGDEYSGEMQEIFGLAARTCADTAGYFNIIRPDGSIDPSGIVKGWAIRNAATLAERMGYHDYLIDAGGDIQSHGTDSEGRSWSIGIRNPFNRHEVIKVLYPLGRGVATSGTAIRGQHIYNPHDPGVTQDEIVSITIVAPDIYEADRFATAAFAMGKNGLMFIERMPGFEAYSVDRQGIATMTSGFARLTA